MGGHTQELALLVSWFRVMHSIEVVTLCYSNSELVSRWKRNDTGGWNRVLFVRVTGTDVQRETAIRRLCMASNCELVTYFVLLPRPN